jgi:hypothetical protein
MYTFCPNLKDEACNFLNVYSARHLKSQTHVRLKPDPWKEKQKSQVERIFGPENPAPSISYFYY